MIDRVFVKCKGPHTAEGWEILGVEHCEFPDCRAPRSSHAQPAAPEAGKVKWLGHDFRGARIAKNVCQHVLAWNGAVAALRCQKSQVEHGPKPVPTVPAPDADALRIGHKTRPEWEATLRSVGFRDNLSSPIPMLLDAAFQSAQHQAEVERDIKNAWVHWQTAQAENENARTLLRAAADLLAESDSPNNCTREQVLREIEGFLK